MIHSYRTQKNSIQLIVALLLMVSVLISFLSSSVLASVSTAPAKPSTANLRCMNGITYIDVTVSSDGGSPITNYEYHIATSHPTSQPTQWTAFSPAQTTSPLEWDMQALGYPERVLHYYYVRAVNAIGESLGSWLANSQSACTNSYRSSPSVTTPSAVTSPETIATTTSTVSVPKSESTPIRRLPDAGMDVKHGIVIAALLWIFGAGLITQARRHFHGPE